VSQKYLYLLFREVVKKYTYHIYSSYNKCLKGPPTCLYKLHMCMCMLDLFEKTCNNLF